MTTPIERVLALAISQLGEEERPARSNRTKFGAELDRIKHAPNPRQGSPWCGTFIDWLFWALKMLPVLDGVNHYGTSAAFQQWRRRGRTTMVPKVGDLAFRSSSGPGHIGIVESVNGSKVTCLEGNTSRSFIGSQTNGGEVCRRTRDISWWRAGFATPHYERASVPPAPPTPPTETKQVTMFVVATSPTGARWLVGSDGRRMIGPDAYSVYERKLGAVDGVPMILTGAELKAIPVAN
jgi:hypothetical protein